MIGMGMRQFILLVGLFEEGDKVNTMEETNKLTASEWLVDSRALVHMTNCKKDLNELENASKSVTIGRRNVMAAQFKGKRTTSAGRHGQKHLGTRKHPFNP